MTEATTTPTYGVTESDFGGDEYCYLGSDEVLWEWATSPVVPFAASTTEIPLPEGYVSLYTPGRDTRVFNADAGLPEGVGDLSAAKRTVTITSGSAQDDKIHILTCAMESVEPRDFYNTDLPQSRILETVSY